MGSTKVKLVYQGVTIAKGEDDAQQGTYMVDTNGDLLDFEYNDNAEGQVDDLSITLRNREGLWLSEWRPKLGAKMLATVYPAFGPAPLVVGEMYIDQFEAGGPEGVVTIRAISTPVAGESKETKRTRAWESVTLKQMAEEIAKAAGLELYYQGDSVEIERADQHEESDLALLKRLADDYGFVLKVSDSKIVLYDQELLEAADVVAIVPVSKGDGMVSRWHVVEKTHGVYRAARVMYRNPIHGLIQPLLTEHPKKELEEPVYVPLKPRGKHRRLTEAQKAAREKARQAKHDAAFEKEQEQYLDALMRQAHEDARKPAAEVEVDDVELFYSPEGAPLVGAVLEIEKRVKNEDEAKRIAQRKLRDANKRAIELTMDIVGDVAIRASANIMLVQAGDFSGKYHIDQATHRVDGQRGYVTSLSAHRVLSYR